MLPQRRVYGDAAHALGAGARRRQLVQRLVTAAQIVGDGGEPRPLGRGPAALEEDVRVRRVQVLLAPLRL